MSDPLTEFIIIGRFLLALHTDGKVWIGLNSGPAAGEGGTFNEADVEKAIAEFYAANF